MLAFQTPLLVVGTGRCGSTMLSRVLAQHPDVASLSELFTSLFPQTFLKDPVDGPNLWHVLGEPRPNHRLWLRLLESGVVIDELRYPRARLARFREAGIPPLLTMTLPELGADPDALHEALRVFVQALPMDRLGVQYRRVLQWLTEQTGRRLWVERSGSSLGYLSALLHFFPDARIVHLVRDGRETALSASRFPPMRLSMISRDFKKATGRDVYQEVPAADVPRLPVELRPLMAQCFDVGAFTRLQIPVERFGAHWSEVMIQGAAQLAKLPRERLLTLRYESILADPKAELRRFLRFLDPNLEQDAWLARVVPEVRPNPPKWTALPGDERARLEAACAPGMAVLARLG